MKNHHKKGSTVIIFVAMLNIVLAIIGICLDTGVMVYYDARLSAAVKFAAISATSSIDENNVITCDFADVERAVIDNLKDSILILEDSVHVTYAINPDKQNECTVAANIDVRHCFMQIFGFQSKTLYESYTAERSR